MRGTEKTPCTTHRLTARTSRMKKHSHNSSHHTNRPKMGRLRLLFLAKTSQSRKRVRQQGTRIQKASQQKMQRRIRNLLENNQSNSSRSIVTLHPPRLLSSKLRKNHNFTKNKTFMQQITRPRPPSCRSRPNRLTTQRTSNIHNSRLRSSTSRHSTNLQPKML